MQQHARSSRHKYTATPALRACQVLKLHAPCREIGWDEKDCWFAHCCMLDADERAFFAERGIGIAHCPSSNMRLASGIAPVCTCDAIS